MVDEAQRGPWVQLAKTLRIPRGAGRPDLVSARPVKLNAKQEFVRFVDDPATNPTLIEFDEHCQANVAFMLRAGSIAPYTASPAANEPAPKTPRRRKGGGA